MHARLTRLQMVCFVGRVGLGVGVGCGVSERNSAGGIEGASHSLHSLPYSRRRPHSSNKTLGDDTQPDKINPSHPRPLINRRRLNALRTLQAVWMLFISDSISFRWGLARLTSIMYRVRVTPLISQTSSKIGSIKGNWPWVFVDVEGAFCVCGMVVALRKWECGGGSS